MEGFSSIFSREGSGPRVPEWWKNAPSQQQQQVDISDPPDIVPLRAITDEEKAKKLAKQIGAVGGRKRRKMKPAEKPRRQPREQTKRKQTNRKQPATKRKQPATKRKQPAKQPAKGKARR
ncbi:MAG: hypothetical protein GY820_42290 [Gammaproteobacteria bacterium]|nr:hypothetical protein [Gammaproteobacteria bacterium]